jgi:hypothetical protein
VLLKKAYLLLKLQTNPLLLLNHLVELVKEGEENQKGVENCLVIMTPLAMAFMFQVLSM